MSDLETRIARLEGEVRILLIISSFSLTMLSALTVAVVSKLI